MAPGLSRRIHPRLPRWSRHEAASTAPIAPAIFVQAERRANCRGPNATARLPVRRPRGQANRHGGHRGTHSPGAESPGLCHLGVRWALLGAMYRNVLRLRRSNRSRSFLMAGLRSPDSIRIVLNGDRLTVNGSTVRRYWSRPSRLTIKRSARGWPVPFKALHRTQALSATGRGRFHRLRRPVVRSSWPHPTDPNWSTPYSSARQEETLYDVRPTRYTRRPVRLLLERADCWLWFADRVRGSHGQRRYPTPPETSLAVSRRDRLNSRGHQPRPVGASVQGACRLVSIAFRPTSSTILIEFLRLVSRPAG